MIPIIAGIILVVVLAAFLFLSRRELSRARMSAKKVTEEKSVLEHRAQSAREEKKRLFAILESMAEGVVVVDTEKKVLLINSALEKYFGFEKSSSEGRHFWEIFRDVDINQMIEYGLRERVVAKKEHTVSLSRSVGSSVHEVKAQSQAALQEVQSALSGSADVQAAA